MHGDGVEYMISWCLPSPKRYLVSKVKWVLRASHELVVELSCMWRESHELLLTLFFFLKSL